MRLALAIVVTASLGAGSACHAAEVAVDPVTGLKMTGDWELVRNNCTACHSSKLITQQRGSEAQWLGMIRWMQKKQNLWPFDPDTEKRIIEYLAGNYPPQADRRRAPIQPDLMPPNPFAPARPPITDTGESDAGSSR
jgi:hypothetical protein